MDKVRKVLEDRGKVYGPATPNFICAERLHEVFMMYYLPKPELSNDQNRALIGMMKMVLHKVARVCVGSLHEDNFTDIHGYTALVEREIMPIVTRHVTDATEGDPD